MSNNTLLLLVVSINLIGTSTTTLIRSMRKNKKPIINIIQPRVYEPYKWDKSK